MVISNRTFDYNKKLIPNDFVSSLEKNVKNLQEAIQKTGLSIGYPGWCLLYYCLYCSLDKSSFNVIVETGTNWGLSTIIMAQALKDSKLSGHIHSVEIDPENYKKAMRNIKKAKVSDFITLYNMNSKGFLNDFVNSLEGNIQFAFLDGSHDEDVVFKEFELIYPRLKSESIVFFDNSGSLQTSTQVIDSVKKVISKILMNYKGNLINFPNTSWYVPGQAIWQRGY